MKAEPLKDKEKYPIGGCHPMYREEDVAAAVAWLKGQGCMGYEEASAIDAAFPDLEVQDEA